MRVRDVGEFGLIARLRRLVEREDPGVVVGIGDDAAVVRAPDSLLLTTDALVENVHFRDDLIDPRALGYKALAVSVSDIAAMGGRPLHALATLCLPEEETLEWVESLYSGLNEACGEFGVTVVGGDVVGTPGPRVLSLTVTGALIGEPLTRSGARPGDLVFVTGDLGGSGSFLDFVEGGRQSPLSPEELAILQARHQRPQPQLAAARLLSGHGCTALDDVSDGLASELHEIAESSKVRIAVDSGRIPISSAVRRYARFAGRDPLSFALYGGEDYQLVGTVDRLAAGSLLARMEGAGIRFTWIGEVARGEPGVWIRTEGEEVCLKARGYDHFARGAQGG